MRTLIVVTSLACAFAVASPALADTPPEIAKTVDAMLGTWTFNMTMKLPGGGDPVAFKEKFVCKKVAAGRGVLCTDTATIPKMGTSDFTHLIAYDAERKAVHWYAVGSSGEVHDHTLHWTSDNALVAEPLTATLNGDPITENFQLLFDGKKKVAVHITTMTKDGEVVLDGTGKR